MAALTDAEWNTALGHFPNLTGNRAQCLKTAEATPWPGPPYYNCIAWSVGSTTEWINPPQPLNAFIQFCFQQCLANQATVDGWALNGIMTHGSRSDGAWNSKLGEWIRMTHPRNGLAGNTYGATIVYFRPNNSPASASEVAVAIAMPELDPAAASKVTDFVTHTGQVFPALTDDFELKWQAWTKTFNSTQLEVAQSSDDFAQGPEWNALVAMGPAILPQVVNKLKLDQNIFGCNLYNKLQTDSKKKVDPKNLEEFYVLNKQAKAIVRLYATQMAEFDNLAADWIASQSAVKISSFSGDYTSGPAFEALRDMGAPAIPLIMDRYASEKAGWWSELLHEIVYGAPSGAQSFDFDALYRQWADWFQGNPATQAA